MSLGGQYNDPGHPSVAMCVSSLETPVWGAVCEPTRNAVCGAVCEPIRNAVCGALCDPIGNGEHFFLLKIF